MKVLVVDDDLDQASLRCLLIEQIGLRPISASSPETALPLAEHERPQCAIVDLHLPALEDGLRLVRNLKSLNSTMTIFVLTGRAPEELNSYLDQHMIEAVFIKGKAIRPLLERLQTIAAISEKPNFA